LGVFEVGYFSTHMLSLSLYRIYCFIPQNKMKERKKENQGQQNEPAELPKYLILYTLLDPKRYPYHLYPILSYPSMYNQTV
jgi:hypothetical protein